MDVFGLFFGRELVKRVDDFTVVPLAVFGQVVGGAHDGDVELAAACADVVPVNEIDMSEFAAIQDAVLDGHALAATEEDGAEVAVGVHAGEIAWLVDPAAELEVHRARMTVLVLDGEVWNHLAHDVEQVVLEVFEVEGIDVVRAFLDHDGAGGVMGGDDDGAVLDA